MTRSKTGFLIFFVIALGLLILNMATDRGQSDGRHTINIDDDFALLLGKETAAWRYIREEDTPILGRYTTIYNRHKHLQFDAPPTFKIPKVIHVIWLGPRHFPIESIENMRSWVAHHPGWTIKFWTDRSRPCPVHAMEEHSVHDFTFVALKKEYDKASSWMEKSEILRYELLLQEGGVYIDHDVRCFRPFHTLHAAYDFYSCLEMPHQPVDGATLTSGTAIIGAKPGHPVIQATIDIIAHNEKTYKEVSARNLRSDVMLFSRKTYVAFTQALENRLGAPGNVDIVFPSSYFLGQDGLPSFYCRHERKSSQQYARTTQVEELFAQQVSGYQSMAYRLLAMQIAAVALLIKALLLCFRRRPAS